MASSIVDYASVPYNALTGQLTEAQKQALILQGQDQIAAVANTPLAQSTPTIQTAARQAAAWNVAAYGSNVDSITAMNAAAPPSPPNYALWILLGLGALVFIKL